MLHASTAGRQGIYVVFSGLFEVFLILFNAFQLSVHHCKGLLHGSAPRPPLFQAHASFQRVFRSMVFILESVR